MKHFLIVGIFFCAFSVLAQPTSSFNSSRNWSINKKEVFLSLGATQFLGDLGGRDQIGTQKSPVDIDWEATRFGGSVGYRFRFHPLFATSSHFYFGLVSGDDANTDEIVRNSRNLHFRSQLVEYSQRFEFIVFANEKAGARYRLGPKGAKTKATQIYLFTGAGALFFNPQAKINGSWENLHPLKTEGQGLPDGADPYSRVTVTIPSGIGFKVAIGQVWRIGLEVSYHKTFSDYIDDVSTNYYDPNALASQVGPNAAIASNPAKENLDWFAPGQQRGNPDDKDAFLLTNIVLTRNISYPRSIKPKNVKWKGRTKF